MATVKQVQANNAKTKEIKEKKKQLKKEILAKMLELKAAGTLPAIYKGYALSENDTLVLMNKKRKAKLALVNG